jgi:hypothetical protein
LIALGAEFEGQFAFAEVTKVDLNGHPVSAGAEVVTKGQRIQREGSGIAGMGLGLTHESALELSGLYGQRRLGFEHKGAAAANQEQMCEAQTLSPAPALAVE